jgi:hypothetical protein
MPGDAQNMPRDLPGWLAALNDEDLHFVKRFLLASGSLKALAEAYGVSYPTIRARLDRLIAKVRAADDSAAMDPFRRALQILLADGKLEAGVARALLDAYHVALGQKEKEREKGQS